jgi:hypothetical protein
MSCRYRSARCLSVVVCGWLLVLVIDGARRPPQSAPEEVVTIRNDLKEVIDLPRRTLSFKPTREDVTVGHVVFSILWSTPDEVRLNGIRLDSAWTEIRLTRAGDIIVERGSGARPHGGMARILMSLDRVATNRFELPTVKLEASTTRPRGQLCLSLKAWFNEISTQYDALYYEKGEDRYALVAWCMNPALLSPSVAARFTQNRVATAAEFSDTLAKPFVIRLNDRPLRERADQ